MTTTTNRTGRHPPSHSAISQFEGMPPSRKAIRYGRNGDPWLIETRRHQTSGRTFRRARRLEGSEKEAGSEPAPSGDTGRHSQGQHRCSLRSRRAFGAPLRPPLRGVSAWWFYRRGN